MIIKCTERGHTVSDKAESCPHCGAPVTASRDVSSIGVPLTTTQSTSKSLKLQSAIWGGMALIATLLIVFQIMAGDSFPPGYMFIIFGIGGIGYIVTGIRIWWHHS